MENAVLIPSVSTGFTDSHFFRDVDIVSYGFAPFLYLQGETTGVHGNNERISIENLTRGTKIMTDFLFEFATD
jgi:acetylornithine deacetylase/succinyl-diaminopimelate desuccinylase-like protein